MGKCKLLAPGLYLRDELSGIQSDIHGKPIVGPVPAPAGSVSAPVRWQGRWTDLGAGKTTLVRHLLRALGVRGRIKSPTYAVVEPHSTIDCAVMPAGEPLQIWHFDFYRFNDPREWEDAGFRELFASPGLKLVEWPERAGDFLPPVDLRIDIEPDEMTTHAHIDLDQDTHRKVSATALTPTGRLLLEALA